jgi:hypothetical protein
LWSITRSSVRETVTRELDRRLERQGVGRNPKLPVSAVSHVFFTAAMKVPNMMAALRDDDGVNEQGGSSDIGVSGHDARS